MIKVLFLIHDLGQGGAEKVLINLVNHMDRSEFDISVVEPFLKPDVHFQSVWPREVPGNSKLMKLLTPKQLHKLCVKETYDIEVAYLEGVSARVIAGGDATSTHLINWIHAEQHTRRAASLSFRSEKEASRCYSRFEKTICVAKTVRKDFSRIFPEVSSCEVLYNTVESDQKVSVRTLEEKYQVHLYILGKGPLESQFRDFIAENHLSDSITLLGYQTNPYQYVAKADLFLCSSHREGFSTATTEALILGVPVCTVEVSGMKEMLGENNEYGVITENSEQALYHGIKKLLDNPHMLTYYRKRAKERGRYFCTKQTVVAVEEMFERVVGEG